MKKVPLKELKEDLAAIAEEVAGGTPIEVTKYNQPYLRMVPYALPNVTYGEWHGRKSLQPALATAKTRNHSLRVLLEDREEE